MPPHDCTLDFLSASSYYQDFMDSPVRFLPDGNIMHEFMEMERIMDEQFDTTSGGKYGSNRPYTCRVAEVHYLYECLDIAGASTLRHSSGASTFNSTFTNIQGALSANVLIHSDLMANIDTVQSQNENNTQVYGISAGCSNDTSGQFINSSLGYRFAYTAMGDGVINGFDTFVLVLSHFRFGPYKEYMGDSSVTDVLTVNGRPDTKDRCNFVDYTRMDWQLRIAYDACFAFHQEDEWQALHNSTPTGRRLGSESAEFDHYLPTSAAAFGSLPAIKGASAGDELKIVVHAADALENHMIDRVLAVNAFYPYHSRLRLTLQAASPMQRLQLSPPHTALPMGVVSWPLEAAIAAQSSPRAANLDSRIVWFAGNDDGSWFLINLPGLHMSIDLVVVGAADSGSLALSNVKAPSFNTRHSPPDPSSYALRFVRHREFSGESVVNCAVVESSRSALAAMHNGVISLSQFPTGGKQLCAFDVVLWKPGATKLDQCAIAVAAGSSAMDGATGSVQLSDVCYGVQAAAKPSTPPPPHTSPPPSPANSASPPPLATAKDAGSKRTHTHTALPCSFDQLCIACTDFVHLPPAQSLQKRLASPRACPVWLSCRVSCLYW